MNRLNIVEKLGHPHYKLTWTIAGHIYIHYMHSQQSEVQFPDTEQNDNYIVLECSHN